MINREIIYERNLTGSYMKIPICLERNFDEKIMLKKKIAGLLPVEKCYEDGAGQYWYNISGKQSLDTFCRLKEVGVEFIEKMIYSICSEIEILDWNLFDQNCLILDPELIFVTNATQEIIFTVYPGNKQSIGQGFQQLMEYLLKKIDHKDMQAVRSAYAIYEKTLDGDFSLFDIRDELVVKKQMEQVQDEAEVISLAKIHRTSEIETLNENEQEQNTIFEQWKVFVEQWKERILHFFDKEKLDEKGEIHKERNSKINKRINQKLNETVSEKLHQRISRNTDVESRKEDFSIVYPEDEIEEVQQEIHPTICLRDYQNHPRGILLYEGVDELKDLKLNEGSNLIGKGKDVDIIVPKDTISKHHAKIDKQQNKFYMEDLNSTNGTYVNEELLNYKEKRELKVNDHIRFANEKYRFI